MKDFPPRDATKSAEQQGLFNKFDVCRIDGSDTLGGKHYGCKYFVLDVDHDPAAGAALRAYAEAVKETHPMLAADLLKEFPLLPQQGGEQTPFRWLVDVWRDDYSYRSYGYFDTEEKAKNAILDKWAHHKITPLYTAAVLPQAGEAKPDALAKLKKAVKPFEVMAKQYAEHPHSDRWAIGWDSGEVSVGQLLKLVSAVQSIAAPAGLGEAKAVAHPDDVAVDLFAAAMKRKLAWCREKGREGWQSDVYCPVGRLQQYLADHVAKGDPIDVGNFAMMIWNRGESTTQGLRARIKNPNAAPVAQAPPVAVHNGTWHWVLKEDIDGHKKWVPARRNENHWDSAMFRGLTLSVDDVGQAITMPAAAQRDDLETLMVKYRIGVMPEYEGQWHAGIFGEEAISDKYSEGVTPRTAVDAAIAAMQGEKA